MAAVDTTCPGVLMRVLPVLSQVHSQMRLQCALSSLSRPLYMTKLVSRTNSEHTERAASVLKPNQPAWGRAGHAHGGANHSSFIGCLTTF